MESKTLHIYGDTKKRPRYLRMLFLLLWIGTMVASAQAQITVKGKVTDETGNGMPGVNIIVKGSTNGTTTDAEGAYTLNVPDASSVLLFSFIGYNSQEQVVGSRGAIDVSLSSNITELNEVVVVGYGTQLKRDVTGAIVKINSDVLMQTASVNAIDQLKGQAAGVNITTASAVPGGGSQIRIRGNRTMVANSSLSGSSASNDAASADQVDAPLLVVDGIPYAGNLNDISPNDIASMEILKDASATAIYGSRGAGGVILISTKRGTQGKTVFSYDAYYGISKVMKELQVFNGEEYAQFKAEATAGNSSVPNTTGYALSPAEQAALAAGVSTDWQKLIYKDAPITNHSLSVSGGTEKSRYSLSAGYFYQGGIIPNQNYSRYSVRSTMDHQLNKRIKIGLNTINTLSYQNTPGGSGVPVGLMRMTPLASPYNADGSVNLLPQTGQTDGQNINPLTLITKEDAILARNRRLRTFNSFYGEVDIIKGLKYKANIGMDFYQDKNDSYSGPGTYVNSSLLQAQSQASVRNTENYQYTVENLLLYENTFGKHKLGLTGLYSFQKNHTQSHYLAALGVPLDYMKNSNFYPAASVNVGGEFDNYFRERGLVSLMGRVAYSYDGRYSLTATVRNDGASVLSPGNQKYTYPAFGAAWNITNEQFMSDVPVISSLKLRAGWGITAAQGIDPYSTLGGLSVSAYNFGQGTPGQQVGTVVNSLPNPDLKWQSTAQYNIGLDFGLIDNRITGAIEFYNQKTSNILLPVSLPPSNGAGSTYLNLGKTQSHGVELTISSTNIKTQGGLVWTTDFNYFFNREEIVELSTPDEKSNIGNGWFVGQPLTVIYDYKKVGIWQTGDPDLSTQTSPVQRPGQIRVMDWNTTNATPGSASYGQPDGKITPDDRMIIGNFQPKFEAGMTNRVSFKRFDLSISVYARIGMKIVVPYVSSEPGGSNFSGYSFFNQSRQNQLKVDYWTPTNPTNAFPRPDASLGAPLYSSTLSYVDGSFLKCRTINLGYDIPSELLNKGGITSLRVYISAVNPFVIWSPFVRDGYGPDPEGNGFGGGVNATGTSNAGTVGRQVSVNANDPATRQFMVGLNLKF